MEFSENGENYSEKKWPSCLDCGKVYYRGKRYEEKSFHCAECKEDYCIMCVTKHIKAE